MTIEKTNQKYFYEIFCDKCENSQEYESDTGFREVYDQAKADGWRAFRELDDSWAHSCPDCVQKWKSSQ